MATQQTLDANDPYFLPDSVFFETVDQAPIAISITDASARILYANPAFSKVTGYPLDEIRGQQTNVLSAGKTPSCIYRELWDTVTQQRIWNGRLVNRRKDNTLYLAELTITPVVDAQGQTTHYLAMHRDITQLQKLNQDLENQRTLTESIVKTSPVATLLLDQRGRLRFQNPAAERLCLNLGCDTEQLLNILSKRLGLVFERCPDFHDLELRYEIPGISTPRWLCCSGSSLKLWQSDDSFNQEQDHDCLLLTVSDISDLKIQQQEVRINALMARLAENELVYSMREALNGAIFKLQSPTNIIGAASNILKMRSGPNDSTYQALLEVNESCRQAIETLKNALPMEPRLRKMPLNMNELLREVLSLYTERLLTEGVVIDWKPCSTLPTILGEEIALCNLIKQLLDNALNAMADNNTRDRELMISTERLADGVRVIIADNGPGIAEELRQKVFEPFFSARKKPGQGTGMGLALVQDVINDHGANIEIASDAGPGCRFNLTFPAYSDQ